MTVAKPVLLVLASTYPRWAGDPEPGFVHELARRLTDVFDVVVVTPHAPGALRVESLEGVRVHRYRYAPTSMETLVHDGGIVTNLRRAAWKWLLVPTFVLGQWLAVRRIVKREQPAVIHAHWLVPQGWIARSLARGRLPYVLTSHGADLFALRGSLFARLRRWAMARAATVTVVSAAMRRQVLFESPGIEVRVMSMGVDTEQRFVPDPETLREAGELLFVGRLVEKKGLYHLLQAMPAVITERGDVHLTIAGFGPERSALERCVGELGLTERVRFLGAVPQAQLPSLYCRASLFVAPFIQAGSGDQEGLGLVLAEAMACGCPVVVGDVPGIHDLVDQSTGIIVNAVDHAALAAAILKLLASPVERQALAARARSHVLQHFAWGSVASGYRSLLLAAAARVVPRK